MELQHVKKGQVLQRAGEYSSYIFHVKSGLLRSYAVDHKGKEHIFMFAPEGWIIADYTHHKYPVKLSIDAIEHSQVEMISKSSYDYHSVDYKKLFKRLAVMQDRITMLLSSTAIERYEHFIKEYPNIAERVPQKMIASYLGITPEALSSLKRKRNQT